MSNDLDNILPIEYKVTLFGKEYALKFTFRNFAAIQKRFGINPLLLNRNLLSGDVNSVIACIWGGTLEFEEFTPEEPAKIKNEVDVEKLYNMGFFEMNELLEPLQLAVLASMPKKDEGIVEDGGKPKDQEDT